MSRSFHQNRSLRYWQARGWKDPLLMDALRLKRRTKLRVQDKRRAILQALPTGDRLPNLRVEIRETTPGSSIL
jgi:hypothetical protein